MSGNQVEDISDRAWHVDKRINLSIIVAIAVQSVILAFWLGALGNRVSNLETNQSTILEYTSAATADRFTDGDAARLEARWATDIARIRTRLDRIEDRLEARDE